MGQAPGVGIPVVHSLHGVDMYSRGGTPPRCRGPRSGRPFMPPIYGLGMGDSDCYHNERHGNSTQTVLSVADAYRRHDMPGAWFLVNDGYGCGFGEGPATFPADFDDLDLVSGGSAGRL